MSKDEEIHMISQPLTTEEGFVNPACMNELEAAIKNMPPTHVRLQDDPEWTRKRWTFLHEITGALAKWAIRQHPYHLPEGLESVVGYLTACLKKEVAWGPLGLAELSLCDINKLLHDILYEKGVKAFDDWNMSRHEKETGEEGPAIVGSSRYGGPPPDRDFICLDALLHNVCLDIRMERRADDLFDENFKKEHGKLPWEEKA